MRGKTSKSVEYHEYSVLVLNWLKRRGIHKKNEEEASKKC